MEGKGKNLPFIQAIPAVRSKYSPKLSKDLKKYKRRVKRIGSLYGSSKSNVKAPALVRQMPEFQSYGAQTVHVPDPLLDLKSFSSTPNKMEMLDFRMSIEKESIGVFYEKNSREENKGVNGIKEDYSNEAKSVKIKRQGGRKDITFEFTDSEDDESKIPGIKDTGILLYYSCKHCEYSDVNVDNVSAHYQNYHPYVIYDQVYIQDPSDLSATFRCLTCPVKFLTLSDLNAHHTENHPLSPNLFTMQSSDLSFKCFVCAFTCSALEDVKTHYKEKHPTYEVDITLTFCTYWVDTREEEQPQGKDCVEAPVSEMPRQCSPNVSAHYQNDHVNSQDPSDLSATFSCLTCPVDFLTLSDLKAHNAENHPHPLSQCTIQSRNVLFKCCGCVFTCNDLEEVKTHYNEKHPTHAVDCTLTVRRNSVDTREEEQPQINDAEAPVSEMLQECSPTTSPTSRKDTVQIVPSNQQQSPASQNTAPANCVTTEQKSFVKTNGPYQYPEKLFYCQKCNYANTTAKGVLNHQIGAHRSACMENVLEHTKKIRDELKHLQSQAEDSSFTCRLPLPLLGRGDRDMLFCHLCNYRNNKMNVILKHYFARHDKWNIECDQVKKHSSIVHKQIEDLRPQETNGQKTSQALLDGEKITRKSREKLSKSSVDSQHVKEESEERSDPDDTDGRPRSPRSEQEEARTLACKVFLVDCIAHPRSVKKDSSVPYPITQRQSTTGERLEDEDEIPPSFESYQVPLEFESPPTMVVSPKKIQCTFCPETFPNQSCVDAHCNKMHRDGIKDNSDAQLGEPSTTSSAHPDKIASPVHVFKCPYCSYVSSRLMGIFIHCSVIHQKLDATKENFHIQKESMLCFEKVSKRKSASSILCGYVCKNCPQIYDSQKTLSKHRQEVHCETTAEPQTLTLDKKKPCNSKRTFQSSTATAGSMYQHGNSDVDNSCNTSEDNTVLVYQCPECPYINDNDYRFLLHCHKKHPSLLVRAKEFRKEKTIIANFDILKNDKCSIIRGYKCKKCLSIFYTAKTLNTHWKRNHSSHKDKASALDKTEDDPNLSSLPQEDDSLYRCKLCPYKGLNQKSLFAHYTKKHKLSLSKRRKLFMSNARDKGSRATAAHKSGEVSHLEGETGSHSEIQSTQQLVSHTRTVPLSVGALDFIVLEMPSENATGLYKCSHCSEHVCGTKMLSSHLDMHRDSAKKVAVDPAGDVAAPLQDEPAVPVTIQDLAPVGPFDVPRIPPSAPSSSPPVERMEPAEEEASFACKYCSRVFKHQKGLDSHRRSHATVAALRKQATDSTSALKRSINKYILYKEGNRRPFLCTLCPYSTTIMSLSRRHLLKKHEYVVKCQDVTDTQGSDQSTVSKVASPTKMLDDLPEHHKDLQTDEGLSYSEAPEVQRQLDHYNKMAQASDTSKPSTQKEAAPAATLLHCELCRYSARCPPTLRKHYSKHHGKKMLTCKDCSFVTSSKKSMKTHRDMGHNSGRQLPATAPLDDLSCPFCLYQTKNKNYMIDHIVLHREERVVPIEPCRPHLSRYLQGIVHRCHKCTFTSGSAESLRLHMTKHDDVKPYKCQLCYFDCPKLSDLETHLSDQHQVLRNHELVGQIRLDKLEAWRDRTPPEEGHTAPDMSANVECDKVSIETQTTAAEIKMDIEQPQSIDTPQRPDLGQEDPQQAQCLSGTGAENKPEVTAVEAENSNSQSEKKDFPIQENQAQLNPGNGEEDDVKKSGLKEKIVQLVEGFPDKRPGLPLTERMFNDAKIEDDVLSCVVQLHKDDCAITKRRKSELDLPAMVETKMESVLAHNRLLFTNPSIVNPTKHDGVRSPSRFTFRRHTLSHGFHVARQKFSSGCVPSTASRDEQIESSGRSEKVENPCGENVGVAEEGHPVGFCKENNQGVDEATHQRKKPRFEDDGAEKPHTSEGAHATQFACNLCGRKLLNGFQLERHIEQHGK